MRRKGLILLMVIAMLAMVAGCAKDKTDIVETEMDQSTMESTDGAMMPVVEVQDDMVGVDMTDIKDQIMAFEDQDVYFGYDQFNLTNDARKILAEKVSFLNSNPELQVRIEGHCDERGTAEYNLALGERRAKAAQDYLVFLGINPNRISIISYGEERPADTGKNEAAWAKNRRAHIDILD